MIDDDTSSSEAWDAVLDGSRTTALLPSQCPRCFEVGTHVDGCMVAANLARGVPAFWAPWAMWVHPTQGDGWVLYRVGRGGRLYQQGVGGTKAIERLQCMDSPAPLVALGPNGPTLAPWGTP